MEIIVFIKKTIDLEIIVRWSKTSNPPWSLAGGLFAIDFHSDLFSPSRALSAKYYIKSSPSPLWTYNSAQFDRSIGSFLYFDEMFTASSSSSSNTSFFKPLDLHSWEFWTSLLNEVKMIRGPTKGL